jgi:methyl-accepting chemotaxis protein
LFANLPLRAKLLLAFLLMTILATSTVAFFNDATIRTNLTSDVGEQLHNQTQEVALGAGGIVLRQVDLLRAFGLNRVLIDQVKEANSSYEAGTDIKGSILDLDKRWVAAADNDQLITSRLNNPAAEELQQYRNSFPDNVEMFVTDKYGAVVAATNRTSDFYQADEAWWQAAWNNGQGAISIGEPLYDETNKSFSINIAVPLYGKNTAAVSGVLWSTYGLDDLISLLDNIRIGDSGRVQLFLPGGQYVTSDQRIETVSPDVLSRLRSSDGSYIEMDYQGVPSFVSQAKLTTISNSPVVSDLNWTVVLHQNRDESLQPVNTAAQATFLISLGTVVLAGLLALVVAQLLSRPILRLTTAARQLAQGDFSYRLALGRTDEIGVLANGFDTMAEALEARIAAEQEARAEAERLQQVETENRQRLERAVGEYLAFTMQIAQGDLTHRIATRYDGALGQLGDGLNSMVGSLHGITTHVQEATSAIAAATAQILAATTEQAASSAEQSAAITETVTSVEEVKVIAQQTAEQAAQIARDSQSALQVARQGDQAVAGTIEGMNQVRTHVQAIGQVMQTLSGHSQAIGSTIATLSELADQITSLAQNAAIESTRAGGAGADLGELARMVRGLSERAKGATGEVRERLSAIQQSTHAAVQGTEQGRSGVEAGASRVNQAGSVIRHLAQEVENGAQANVQMAAAAQQQMIGMEQIGLAMTAIQQATTQALAGTQQAEQAAQDLHMLAQSLQQAIATYRL